MIRVTDEFSVAAPPSEVFASMVDPQNLAKWQTIKTAVTPLTDDPPRHGYRIRESSRIGPRRWEQTVEFTEFEPGHVFVERVVEGPPNEGRYVMEAGGPGTRVRFEAAFDVLRVLAPVQGASSARFTATFKPNSIMLATPRRRHRDPDN